MVALTRPKASFEVLEYRAKIAELEKVMQAVYPKNWNKVKWKYTKQYRNKLRAKAMVYQSEINECKIYISLLGG